MKKKIKKEINKKLNESYGKERSFWKQFLWVGQKLLLGKEQQHKMLAVATDSERLQCL